MEERSIPAGALNHFLYSRYYDHLCECIGAYLGISVLSVSHRNQLTVEVDQDTVFYTFFGWIEYAEEEYKEVRVTCSLKFNGTDCELSVIDIFDMKQEPYVQPPTYGLAADQNLIPKLHKEEQREEEAERFLRTYCPETLTTPMPVPIRSIMEKQMGIEIISNIQLIGDSYGQTTFTDCDELVMDDAGTDIMILPCRRGTVLVDGMKAFQNGMGFLNFTLAHEAYHWFSHRPYVDFHRMIEVDDNRVDDNSSYNGTSSYSSTDIIEIQANAVAARILMPGEMFLQKYEEIKMNDFHETIASLASFFCVSYSAAAIRLSQIGISVDQNVTETRMVTPEEAFSLYIHDTEFRELVDNGTLVYINHSYYYNDPKYVEEIWEDVPTYQSSRGSSPYRLTEYAIAHPEEAQITFTIDHKHICAGGNILLRESAEKLLASVEAIRKNFPDEARILKQHSDHFEKWCQNNAGKHQSFTEVARDMIIYRYGRDEDYHEDSLEARMWNPEKEMPDVHEKYFQRFRFNKLNDRYNEMLDQIDPDEDTMDYLEKELDKEEELENDIDYRYQSNLEGRVLDENKHIWDDSSSPCDLFCADTLQPSQVYSQIMKGKAKNPDMRKLMSLCVGLCLSSQAANALMHSAGRTLTWDRENMAYRYIITHLRGRYIEDVNVFLDNLGLDLIGAKIQTKGK